MADETQVPGEPNAQDESGLTSAEEQAAAVEEVRSGWERGARLCGENAGALGGTHGPGESIACPAVPGCWVWGLGRGNRSFPGDSGEPEPRHGDGLCSRDAPGSRSKELSHGNPGAIYAHPGGPVTHGAKPEPNHLYVLQPGQRVQLRVGAFYVEERTPGQRGPLVIDTFFRSLASEQKNHAIGVVLSGADSDGASGLKGDQGRGRHCAGAKPGNRRAAGNAAEFHRGRPRRPYCSAS